MTKEEKQIKVIKLKKRIMRYNELAVLSKCNENLFFFLFVSMTHNIRLCSTLKKLVATKTDNI